MKEAAKKPQHHKRGWTITAAVTVVVVGVYLVSCTLYCLPLYLLLTAIVLPVGVKVWADQSGPACLARMHSSV